MAAQTAVADVREQLAELANAFRNEVCAAARLSAAATPRGWAQVLSREALGRRLEEAAAASEASGQEGRLRLDTGEVDALKEVRCTPCCCCARFCTRASCSDSAAPLGAAPGDWRAAH